jgi:serine phosphatase RsbU (regulator of sigma subunit)
MRVPGTIIEHVVADRRGVLLGETTGQFDALASEGEVVGTRMGAPIVAQQISYGVIYVESKGAVFRQEDVDLLQSVAAQTGLAIHAARVQSHLLRRQRLERDLRMARQIQRSLLPALPPNVVGLDFAIHYEPAYQIGGDFYDFIWHDQSHVALVVGDVAGKAISAALYMARLTSELRSRAGISRTPARLLRRVNDEMVKIGDDGMFATLVYAIYDLESRTLVFTNAGHCVPLLRRGDRVFPLHADRAHIAPVGILADLEVGEARVQLHTGDMLILTSDGILEARDTKGNEYGLKRLSRRIRTARGTAEDVVKAILQDVDGHVANAPQGDDMTIVAMSIDERRAKRRTSTLPGVAPPEPPATIGPDGAPIRGETIDR